MAGEPASECASAVWDTFHKMMRAVRPDPHKRPTSDLSMQQFRVMITMKHHEGASLSQLREHMGTSISSASKLVDGLVDRGFVRRETAEDDRRRLILALTEDGEQALKVVDMAVLSRLAGKLASLSHGECAVVTLAMDLLREALNSVEDTSTTHFARHSEQREESALPQVTKADSSPRSE